MPEKTNWLGMVLLLVLFAAVAIALRSIGGQ